MRRRVLHRIQKTDGEPEGDDGDDNADDEEAGHVLFYSRAGRLTKERGGSALLFQVPDFVLQIGNLVVLLLIVGIPVVVADVVGRSKFLLEESFFVHILFYSTRHRLTAVAEARKSAPLLVSRNMKNALLALLFSLVAITAPVSSEPTAEPTIEQVSVPSFVVPTPVAAPVITTTPMIIEATPPARPAQKTQKAAPKPQKHARVWTCHTETTGTLATTHTRIGIAAKADVVSCEWQG